MQGIQVFRNYAPAARPESPALTYCPRCGSASPVRCDGERPRPTCDACGYVQYRNPSTGVAVLVVDSGRIVVGRRRSSQADQLWSLPAGYIEYDEDFLSAARRETFEETGLEVELQGIVTVCSSFDSPQHHALVIVVAGRPIGGALRAGDDLVCARWLDLVGEWPSLTPQSHHAIELYRAGGGQLLPVDPRFAHGGTQT